LIPRDAIKYQMGQYLISIKKPHFLI